MPRSPNGCVGRKMGVGITQPILEVAPCPQPPPQTLNLREARKRSWGCLLGVRKWQNDLEGL